MTGLAADHRVELAPVDLALGSRQPGLRHEHLRRQSRPRLRSRHASGPPRPGTATRRSTRRAPRRGGHGSASRCGAACAARHGRRPAPRGSTRATPRSTAQPAPGSCGRRLRRRQRRTHLTAMHPEPGRQRPHAQPLVTTSETDLLVQLHLGQSLSPHLDEHRGKARTEGQVGPTQTVATPPKWGQLRPSFSSTGTTPPVASRRQRQRRWSSVDLLHRHQLGCRVCVDPAIR